MALRKVGVIFTAQGHAQYMSELKQVNQEMRMMSTQAKLAVAQLGNNASISDTYSTKMKSLSAQVELASSRVAKYKDMQQNLPKRQEEVTKSIESTRKAFEASKKETANLKKVYDDLKVSTTATAEEMDVAKKAYKESSTETKLLKNNLTELSTELQNNSKALATVDNDLAKSQLQVQNFRNEEERLTEAIHKQGARLADTAKKWDEFGDKAQKIAKPIQAAGASLTKNVTAPIVALGGLSLKAASDWDTAMASMQKTNDEVVDSNGNVIYSYEDLSTGIRDLAKTIPVSASKLAEMAAQAGQLGIATQDVVAFTDTMAKLSVTTNLSSEEAASSMAQFLNITGSGAATVSNLASSIVELGNNTATTEKDILMMSQRWATTGKLIGLSDDQIMAFSASLLSMGVNVEAGGSSLQRFGQKVNSAVLDAGTDLELLAKTSNMTASDFSKAWNDKPAYAIQEFLKGLEEVKNSGGNVNEVLADLGITSVSELNALLALAGGHKQLSTALDMSARAYKENTALGDEATVAFETFGNKLQIFKNKMTDVLITLGGPLLDAVTSGLDAAEPWIEKLAELADAFSKLDEAQQRNIIGWVARAAALGPSLSVLAKTIDTTGKASKGISKAIALYGSFTTDRATKELTKYGVGAQLATTKTALLGKGLAALTSPAGLTVVAVGSLYTAYKLFGEEAHKTYKAMKEFPDITGVTGKQADSLNEVSGSFEELDVAFRTLGTNSVGHASTVVGAVDNIVTEIGQINSGKLDDLTDSLKNLPPDVQAAIQQALSDSVGLAEGQITRAQEIAAEISAIYDIAKQEQRDLHDFELQRVMGLEAELQGIYSRVLGNSFEQQQQIYTNLTKGLAEMTEKQLEERQFTILEYANKEAETLKQAKEGLESAWQEGLITPDEFTSGLEILEESYSDNLRKLNVSAVQTAKERFDRLNEGFETSFDDLVKFVSDATGLGFNEIVTALQSEAPNFDASIKNMIGVVEDGVDGLQEAANKWDKAISDFAQSKGLTPSDLGTEHLNEFIEQSKAAGLTWEELNLLSKDANVDDNIKDFLNKTAEAQGGWDAIILAEKNAEIKVFGMDDLERIVELFGVEFDSLDDVQKEALVKTSGYGEFSDLLYDYGIWKRESPAEPKQAVLETDQAMAAYKELFISQGLWNDSEFLSHIAYIDTNAPDFEEKLATAISEWTGIPVEEVKAMMVETNADDATASIEGTGQALNALGGRSATVTVNAVDNASGIIASIGRGLSGLNGFVATTYVDTVARGRKGFATGGHIDAYAEGGNIQYAGMFASGGNVPKGYSGIVGEDGAELFTVTDRGVTITPLSPSEKIDGVRGSIAKEVAEQLNGKGGGGITYETNIHITGPVVREDNDIKKLTNQITQAVNKQIGEQTRNKLKGRST